MGGIPEFGILRENFQSNPARIGHDIRIPQQVAKPEGWQPGLGSS